MNLVKSFLVLCTLLLLCSGLKATPPQLLLFGTQRFGYSPTQYAEWVIRDGKSILSIRIPEGSKVNDQTYGVHSIILPRFRTAGKRLRISAEVKGENIQKQTANHRKARILLRYRLHGKTINLCSKGYDGTFDWRSIKLESSIPSEADQILVTIGMQNTTGNAAFRNISIEEIDPNGPEGILAFGRKIQPPPTTQYAEWNIIEGKSVLKVEYPADAIPKDQTFGIASFPVDVSSCMGKEIEISCLAKGSGIAPQKYPNHSARILVRFHQNGKNIYKLSRGRTGTFDWTPLSCKLKIPEGVGSIYLSIGLQKTTGTAEFKEIRIEEKKRKPLPSYSSVGEMRLTDLEWNLPPGAERSGNVLTVHLPETTDKAQLNAASAEFDISGMRGKQITFSIRCRGDHVTRPAKPWNGIKFMLLIQDSSGRKNTPGAMNLFGTFDWKTVHFTVRVPKNAVKGVFFLGLQDAAGSASFQLDSFQGADLSFRKRNPDWICEYSPEIRNRPRHRGVMIGNNLTKKDFQVLAEWGCNLVRAQLVRKWGVTDSDRDLDDYNRWIAKRLDLLERQIEWCHELGIKMIIDLHNPPGGRNASLDFNLYHEKKYFDRFLSLWEEIAERFKENPALYGYDLINEPHQTSPAKLHDYWEVQRIAAERIRAIDPETPIYVASNDFNSPSAYSYMSPLKLKNIIYQVHFYLPGSYTHQGLNNTWGVKGKNAHLAYPGVIDGIPYHRESLKKQLEPVLEFAKRHRALIFCGEFSAIIWAKGAERYLQDCIDLWEEFAWDWTYHAFREYRGWSVEHEWNGSRIIPSKDNPRKQVLLRAFQKNKPSAKREQNSVFGKTARIP